MENTTPEIKKKPNLWLFVSIALVIICAVLTWKLVTTNQKVTVLTEEKTVLNEEKATMIANLEKLQKEYDQLSKENEGLNEMFEKEKAHVEKLLNQIRNAEGSVAKYKNQVTQLEGRLKEYEAQIAKLKEENKALVEENFVIKTDLDSTITETENLTAVNVDLTTKVNAGAVLTAYDLDASGIKISNKKEVATYKSKKADKVRVSFTLGENTLTSPGQKDVYVRIADPSGKILTKAEGDEYSFEFQSNKLQYSIKETITYQNKAVDVLMYWDKVGEFTPGTYTVDIFVDGNDIATTQFMFEK
jgi:predicted nuclease with TOPRIM domain